MWDSSHTHTYHTINQIRASHEVSKTNEVLPSDKSTTILEESISNTNTPTNNKKDTCSRQQLVGEKDNYNIQSSLDIQNNYLHSTKHPSIVPSPLESLTHKKQAINSDSLCLSQSFGGGTLPPLPSTSKF